MSTKKKPSKPKKVDFLELSSSKQAHLLKKAKENLRQKLMEQNFGSYSLKPREFR